LLANQRWNQVEHYVNSLDKAPWAVFCVAGGTNEEIGFFADISADSIRACMEKNFFSSVFIANAMMKRWIRLELSS
jgi:3-dehydrosphinganine reductase